MQGETLGGSAARDRLGRYKPGYSSRRAKLEQIAAKLSELIAEYFPNGGYSRMDPQYLISCAQFSYAAGRLLGLSAVGKHSSAALAWLSYRPDRIRTDPRRRPIGLR
jgi:hypothetical protein